MKITLHEISVRELVDGYKNDEEEGVVGYHGRLNIRPKYQREFIYGNDKRNAVIDTLRKDFPLNVMYWVVTENGTYELLDGQQRTISICEYVDGQFSFQKFYFHNLTEDQKDQILNYKLMIYFCEGKGSEILDWFRTINISGEKLTDQELLNINYTGPWLTDAKRHFSKTKCVAYQIGSKYLIGKPIRQEYLRTALKWISHNQISEYMGKHQHDPNANALWTYFRNVIDWVDLTFPTYRKEMKGQDWGALYDSFHDKIFDAKLLEKQVSSLMEDSDVTDKKGIYTYVLTGKENKLHIRTFDQNTRRTVYEQQKGICPLCHKHFKIEEMEADHIIPWSKGGHTVKENCQMLCIDCNRRKSNK